MTKAMAKMLIQRAKTVVMILVAYHLSLITSYAQKVDPQAYYIDEEGNEMESRNVDKVDAPLDVTFRSNPSEMDDFSPSYEWHFRKMNSENSSELVELFVRYEEDTQYVFTEAGTYHVVQKTFLGQDENMLDSTLIVVVIPSSKLEFPNAFSPNGDGHNDTYHAKEGYKGIVSFHATIINRWGQKIYEWSDPAGEWDGTFKGKPVRDGVYFVIVNAKGSDGVKYNIRKDVNLLRGLRDKGTGTSTDGGDAPTE